MAQTLQQQRQPAHVTWSTGVRATPTSLELRVELTGRTDLGAPSFDALVLDALEELTVRALEQGWRD
jgi:hypothetical protein